MRWHVGILTWNRHDRCAETIRAFEAGVQGDYSLTLLDNGSDVPFESTHNVVRSETNLGAGGGVSELTRYLLDDGAERILFLEDDWTLENPLDLTWLDEILSDPQVGQIRLALRPERPSPAYWTYALEGEAAAASLAQQDGPIYSYPGGRYLLCHLLWSNNPFACRRDTAERFLLTGLDEIQMARPYLASELLTATTTPGHFRHEGQIRDRRGLPGWRK